MALYEINKSNPSATPALLLASLGTTVEVTSHEVRIMSDVWEIQRVARYYDAKEGAFKTITVAGEDWKRFDVDIDAEEEVVAKWENHKINERIRAIEQERDAAMAEARAKALTPAKGKTVTVFKGRKLPIGTTGTVKWVGETRYGVAVGIKVEGKEPLQWTDIKNVKVVDVDAHELLRVVSEVEDRYNLRIDAIRSGAVS